jgi:Peptidase_C39 like family
MSKLQIFSQNNPQWSNQQLGTSDVTIGGYGCIITCLAMACTYFGKSTTPSTVDAELTQSGGYSNGNLYNFNAIEKITNLKETESVFSDLTDSGYAQILPHIKEGVNNPNKICIIQIDFVPNTYPMDSHYVIVNRILDDNTLEIIDPWNGTIRPLSDYYGTTVSKPSDTVKQVFCIVGQVANESTPQPSGTPKPFHLQSESDLNDWIAKWGINRLNELGIKTYSQADIDSMQLSINAKQVDLDTKIGELKTADAKIKELEDKINAVPVTVIKSEPTLVVEKFNLQKFIVGMSKDGALYGLLGAIATGIQLSISGGELNANTIGTAVLGAILTWSKGQANANSKYKL